MESASESNLTKITAKLYAPMFQAFDKQLSQALLRRDAFLDRMIAVEIEHLREDLAGKKLSAKAKRYISQSLKNMGNRGTPPLRQVSISVSHKTANSLAEAVKTHNLVRDSFLNWIIALLRSSDVLLDYFGLPTRISSFRRDGTEDMPTSPLRGIDEIQCDPFYYLRHACESINGCGLYALELPKQLHGFSCYLPDEDVPNTPENEEMKLMQERWLKDLGDFGKGISPMATRKV